VVYDESIEERRHADRLVKRILFLDGLPNLQDLHKLSIGEGLGEVLRSDLALETDGRGTLVEAVAYCEGARDFVSREILVDILTGTEDHIDYLSTQLGLLDAMGEPNYAQSAAGPIEE
jgi:bacterioferritin